MWSKIAESHTGHGAGGEGEGKRDRKTVVTSQLTVIPGTAQKGAKGKEAEDISIAEKGWTVGILKL